jgi:hypothetical protein
MALLVTKVSCMAYGVRGSDTDGNTKVVGEKTCFSAPFFERASKEQERGHTRT